jgi:ribosomal RNA-processing protein 9
MAFRRGTPTLYTGSLDRTLRVYSLALGASGFVEALFGHQDSVQHLDAGRTEVAVSVGGRDRTARWWKIADETQLVFRGGGRSRLREVLEGGAVDGEDDEAAAAPSKRTRERRYVEGSLECVAMIDETTFVSGGDSGCASSILILSVMANGA